MEWLSSFAGLSGLPALILVFAVVLIMLFAIKKGWISFSGHGLKVGETIPRELIRNQWELAQTTCEAQFAKIRPYCETDVEAKYLISKINDIFQAAIVYNYMSTNENYITAKQHLVLNSIRKRSSNPHFQSLEFEDCCNRFTENLIKDLVRMKEIQST